MARQTQRQKIKTGAKTPRRPSTPRRPAPLRSTKKKTKSKKPK